jgi:uncharacterized membrane protein YtjA (UPF0391 family)
MDVHQIQEKLFDWFIRFSYILIIATTLGLSAAAPKYLDIVHYYLNIYICLFLIWRFNPFRTIVFRELDRKIAFHAGIILFTTSVFTEIYDHVKHLV